ncbi:fatty acid desaturase [Sphingomonas sp. TREG-RG-20F-R18-01]|uniref:fatty acid desaturase family protein n=1 Tax=Sphingomonas sp. TREG-RG-20F-R18-01 TaxID=2914982 RepID=UPI001F59EA60|nr:fatty acid desaturase [Sphingomonas sp. TREG-RG-20F-R18-01]
MTTTMLTFDRRADERTTPPSRVPLSAITDDKAMLRAVVELTRDLNAPKPAIYWTDLLASAAVGYAGLVVAMTIGSVGWALVAAGVAILGLYRAGMFIHEVSHMKHSAVPGFRLGFNTVVGVPLLVPSFMYEGVHNLHHAKTRYGTAEDPEYLPLAHMKPWTLPLFLVSSILAPMALLFRYAVLTPLSLVVPGMRTLLVSRFSSLSINPQFRRRMPEGEVAAQWRWLEGACSVWAIGLIASVVAGVFPLHMFAIALGVASGVYVLNQVRTLVAHLWDNDGETMTVTAQYLDTVNVPPPALLPVLWAPVGLRYHALHHLLPSVPYHALNEAHRRLVATLAPDSPYHKSNYAGLPGLVARLVRSTMVRAR